MKCSFQSCEADARFQTENPFEPGLKYACEFHKNELMRELNKPKRPTSGLSENKGSLMDMIHLADLEIRRREKQGREPAISRPVAGEPMMTERAMRERERQRELLRRSLRANQ